MFWCLGKFAVVIPSANEIKLDCLGESQYIVIKTENWETVPADFHKDETNSSLIL